MNLQQFLDHWKIVENPFRGEEARQDPVFLRLEAASQAGLEASPPTDAAAKPANGAPATGAGQSLGPGVTSHSDFEKIAGDFTQPSTAIVFGEKGSGKTAIRLQLADRVHAYNAHHPTERCLWIGYDDLNPVLARFLERAKVDKKPDLTATLGKLRLVDHIDAILTLAVPAIVDVLLKQHAARSTSGGLPPVTVTLPASDEPRKAIRKMDPSVRRDLLALQVAYDRPDVSAGAEKRTQKLRNALRIMPPWGAMVWTLLVLVGWMPAAAWIYLAWQQKRLSFDMAVLTHADSVWWTIAGLLGLYLLVLLKRSVWDRLKYITLGHRLRKQIRVSIRSDSSYGRSMRMIPRTLVDAAVLPMTSSDEVRYAMLERLKRVLAVLGYRSILVVIDRVDEPTLIPGDGDQDAPPDRAAPPALPRVRRVLPGGPPGQAEPDRAAELVRCHAARPVQRPPAGLPGPGDDEPAAPGSVRRGRHQAGPGRGARPDAPAARRLQAALPVPRRPLRERDERPVAVAHPARAPRDREEGPGRARQAALSRHPPGLGGRERPSTGRPCPRVR
jgi:hypothetical protein